MRGEDYEWSELDKRMHAQSNVRVSHVILDEFDAFGHVVLHLNQLLLDEHRTDQLED